jgi:hypothetical protein
VQIKVSWYKLQINISCDSVCRKMKRALFADEDTDGDDDEEWSPEERDEHAPLSTGRPARDCPGGSAFLFTGG